MHGNLYLPFPPHIICYHMRLHMYIFPLANPYSFFNIALLEVLFSASSHIYPRRWLVLNMNF